MARLPQGMRMRSNGTYEMRFQVDGKRYSAYGTTAKICKEKELEIRAKIKEGTYSKNVNVTFEVLVSEYLVSKKNDVKESSLSIIKGQVKNHLIPEFGCCKVKDIEVRQIEKWFNDLQNKLSLKICNTLLGYLKDILKYAQQRDVIIKNPAEVIKPYKVKKKSEVINTIHRALTREEVDIFMEEAKRQNHTYYEVFAFMLSTGCRIGEVACLTWRDIDYKNNLIHINKTVTFNDKSDNNDNRYVVGDSTKSESGMRDIYLNDNIKTILKRQKEKDSDFGDNTISLDAIIFKPIKGKYLMCDALNYSIRTILKDLDKKGVHIDKFSSHAFRDTFATLFIENGGSPNVLKEILGHGSYQMTMDLYAHVLDNTKAKEMTQFAKIINI